MLPFESEILRDEGPQGPQSHLHQLGRRGFLAARRSRNQTPPLLHRMEERAGERRGRPSPRSSPHSCVAGRGRRKLRGNKSSQPATISTDIDRLAGVVTEWSRHHCTTAEEPDASLKMLVARSGAARVDSHTVLMQDVLSSAAKGAEQATNPAEIHFSRRRTR